MRDMIVSELSQAMHEVVQEFAHLLPRLLVMLIIVCAGWLVAFVVKAMLRSALRLLKFDRLSEDAGAAQLLNKAALPSSTELLSRLVFWVVLLGFILLGINALGVIALEEDISRFFLFLPRLFVAVLILFFGMFASSFFSRATLLAAVNANLRSARMLSYAARVIIVVLAVSMAFEELGIAENTILAAFSIVFGALMLGLAIAFGIGGRDLARQFLERRFAEESVPVKKDDELSPL
jgi:Conserved TM helix